MLVYYLRSKIKMITEENEEKGLIERKNGKKTGEWMVN